MPNSHGPDLKPQMSGSRTSPALPTRGRRQGVPFPLDICGPRVEFVPLSAARRLGRVWIINAIEQLGPVVLRGWPFRPWLQATRQRRTLFCPLGARLPFTNVHNNHKYGGCNVSLHDALAVYCRLGEGAG